MGEVWEGGYLGVLYLDHHTLSLETTHMMIYIDESGNLGAQGRYFVIACLVPPANNRLKNLVKTCRLKFGNDKPLKELKAYHLSFEQRQHFLNKLTSAQDFWFAYLVADKHHLRPELLQNKEICFNYLVGHLLKPIVTKAQEPIEIICDNRNIAVASGKTLEGYLQTKAYGEWEFRHTLQLCFADSHTHNHLQCVDVLSNTILGNYSLNKTHFYQSLSRHKKFGIRFPFKQFGIDK